MWTTMKTTASFSAFERALVEHWCLCVNDELATRRDLEALLSLAPTGSTHSPTRLSPS
jgi:hypothetical protein